MKRVNSYGTGDHYIHLKIKIPQKLSAKQKALIQVIILQYSFKAKIKNYFLKYFQAFAEIETDTPGQIFGVTFKTDGKSPNDTSTSRSTSKTQEPLSAKFTQGSKDDNFDFAQHDISDTKDYRKEILGGRSYFSFGVALIFIAFLYYTLSDGGKGEIEMETEIARIKQKERKKNGPFDEAQKNFVLRIQLFIRFSTFLYQKQIQWYYCWFSGILL